MSWNTLPTELHLAIIHILPHTDIRAFSYASSSTRTLCLPAIFANVIIPNVNALRAFVRHVPTSYGAYVRSLSISTKHAHAIPTTNLILSMLAACTRLYDLSLSLASSIDPATAIPAFARLHYLNSFHISCWGREDISPVSERLVVALAASLPSLTHLSLSRITRSAVHVDPCDVPSGVPIVTNDVDVPPHPLLGSDLSLPNLLRLPSLRTLIIRDTWMGCDSKIDPAISRLDKLMITGSMYATDESEARACATWVHACSPLRLLELGTALAPPVHPSGPPRVPHVYIDAARVLVNDLPSTLDALKSCGIESISIGYEQEQEIASQDVPKAPMEDDFARECALDDLEEWSTAIETFLLDRSKEDWSALAHVNVSFGRGIEASWHI